MAPTGARAAARSAGAIGAIITTQAIRLRSAVLRRIRVRLSEPATPPNRHLAMQLLNLAIIHAQQLRIEACVDALRSAAPLISADRFEEAERLVTEAMARFGEHA
ncbi:MAG: hypothetical protein NVV62_10710 [Terricaulis sp.]|nr:hypothetical protein [Terricaulis sp.]